MKTISNWIDKYDIERNRRDPEWLADRYIKERLSQHEIAELCKTGSSTIGDQIRKYGISRDRNYRDEAWLREKYTEEELTIHDIADLVGVGAYAVRYWLITHEIERRDNGFRNGEKHPFWKEDTATDDARLARWSQAAKERDGHECVSCSSAENLHPHHIIPRYEDRSVEMVYGR